MTIKYYAGIGATDTWIKYDNFPEALGAAYDMAVSMAKDTVYDPGEEYIDPDSIDTWIENDARGNIIGAGACPIGKSGEYWPQVKIVDDTEEVPTIY